MTWLLVIILAALYVALMLRVAYWAEVFLREERCTCTRHRVCAACLERAADLRREKAT